ncbi:MAG: hypothetical protein AAFX46_02830, partial [Cyanobacteria bacterium J06636_27]
KLGFRTDLAVEGRWIGQSSNNNPDFDEFGIAVEGGYYLTPDLRLGVGYAFGSVDDRDFTGFRSTGGLYLNVSLKLNELFGGFGLQKPVPKQEQESEVSPLVRDGSQRQSEKPKSKLAERLKKNQSDKLVNRLKKQQGTGNAGERTEKLPTNTSNTQSRILENQNKSSQTKLINNLKK